MLVKTSANNLPLPQTVQHVRLGHKKANSAVDMQRCGDVGENKSSSNGDDVRLKKSLRVEMATQTPSRRVLMPTGTRKNKRASVKLKLDIVANTQEESIKHFVFVIVITDNHTPKSRVQT